MYRHHYSRFLDHLGDRLHFAAHSHHAWPDVSRDAHLQYWDDSARLLDDKWEYLFSKIVPSFQKRIASMLSLRDETQIALAPNTHELLIRLLSTFDPSQYNTQRPIKILTSQNEFHSFRRQIQRLEEAGLVAVTRIQADELAVNRSKFLTVVSEKLRSENYDLFFMSQVFFDSGLALSTEEILALSKAAPINTVICIDGYHAFAAIPVDLSALEGRIFYLGGGYKYAQAGEGACFMVVPKGNWRPINTGWYANIENLSSFGSSDVPYPSHGSAFLGATQDPSGIYRFNAVWNFFEQENISVSVIHQHVVRLQNRFLTKLADTLLAKYRLININESGAENSLRGHFLTFDLESPENCVKTSQELKKRGVLTDFRGQRLRIGFGLYHSELDADQLILKLREHEG